MEYSIFSTTTHTHRLVPTGAYYNGMDQEGRSMADQQTFGSVVATILVIVVTMQVGQGQGFLSLYSPFSFYVSLLSLPPCHFGSLLSPFSHKLFIYFSLLICSFSDISEQKLRSMDTL